MTKADPKGPKAAPSPNTASRTFMVCSCEATMPIDDATIAQAISKACPGAALKRADHLCRVEVERFRAALAAGTPLTVACTQEAPLFAELADAIAGAGPLDFVNIRETA